MGGMSGSCEHVDFAVFVDVARITDGDDGPVTSYSATVLVECSACGEPFEWIGPPVGLSPRYPTVSVDGTGLRAPLRPRSAPSGFGESGPGFRVTVRG